MKMFCIFVENINDMHYLIKALKQLQGVYYTPKQVTDKIQLDLLIGNPPYATNRQTNPDKRG